ncbi:MAG: glutathione-disulfide reductase [Caulobacteraceae bacterium]|nr:glutathione-disulfide reductase [Caulobacter sp.]
MADFDYDLFVIGAGSGGVRAARLAATCGARVAIAEESRVGGTCVIRGCVPKKFMVYASEFAREFEVARAYGWSFGEPGFDWNRFRMERDTEVARLSGVYEANLAKSGCDLLHGRATFLDAHTLEVRHGDKPPKRVTAAKILIAAGGRPRMPADVPGIEHAINSDQVFDLPELPRRMLIAGGGYIAVEFASIFHALGVDVTLAYRGSNLLRGFDEDVRAHLADELHRSGLRVALACEHERLERREDGVILSHVLRAMPIETDVVMFATGREPHTKGLGLDKAGVRTRENGAVEVDAHSRTSVEHIWAVGDVTDRLNLTPVAIREAQAFVQTEFHGQPCAFDHADVPTSVFSQPPVGCVGLSEAQARHQYGKVEIYLARFRPMKTILAKREDRVLMKLVVAQESGRVVGAHMVGPDAPEIIQLAAIAVKAGLTKAQWDETCALHPTVAEEFVTMREAYVPNELSVAAE